jgi:NAD(P)-dependent dehydrogenase (short-subunit alcohol dehydrogenase family)
MTSAQGKTVIVTGAAGGLGKAIATAFLAAGANVAVCDVHTERLASVEEEWSKSYADKFLTRKTDVTDEASVQALVDATVAKFGRLDVLVNSAGIMDGFEPAGACSKEKWDRVLNVNLNGPFLGTKAAIAQFEKQEPDCSVIINIGSIASVHGFKAGVAYSASKAALMSLTKNTAGYYGDKSIYSIGLMLGGKLTTFTSTLPKFPRHTRKTADSFIQGWTPTSRTHSARGCTWRLSKRSRPRKPPSNRSCRCPSPRWPSTVFS